MAKVKMQSDITDSGYSTNTKIIIIEGLSHIFLKNELRMFLIRIPH